MNFWYAKEDLLRYLQKLTFASTQKIEPRKLHTKVLSLFWKFHLFLVGVCHAESKRLKLEHYLACLYDGKSFKAINRGFKVNKNRQMMYYELPKEGLNPIFLKFDLDEDLITCKPLKKDGIYL